MQVRVLPSALRRNERGQFRHSAPKRMQWSAASELKVRLAKKECEHRLVSQQRREPHVQVHDDRARRDGPHHRRGRD